MGYHLIPLLHGVVGRVPEALKVPTAARGWTFRRVQCSCASLVLKHGNSVIRRTGIAYGWVLRGRSREVGASLTVACADT